MTQACQVCNHVSRLEIDRHLVSNRSLASLSRQYGVSKVSLSNHRKNHLSHQLLVSQKNRDIFTGETLMSLIQGWLTTSERILRECEQNKKYNVALKAMAQGRATAQFFWEVSVKLQEIKAEEERTKFDESSDMAIWKKGIDLLPLDEHKALADLQNRLSDFHDRIMTLGSGKRQGRRTDLERKRKQREATARHRAKKKTVESAKPFKLKRRKIKSKPEPEKPENEFDVMRERLNMPNEPEPPKQRGWLDP